MTHPSSKDLVERLTRNLSRQQRQYILFGPHPHWTQTRWALERRGLYDASWKLTKLGRQVRATLKGNGNVE